MSASGTFGLVRTYPNPLNSITTVEYDLLKQGKVELVIYNHLGQQIDELVNTQQAIGKHQAAWDTEGLPAGIYYYRLQSGNHIISNKIIKM